MVSLMHFTEKKKQLTFGNLKKCMYPTF